MSHNINGHELAKCAKEGNCQMCWALGSLVLMAAHQGFKCFCFVLKKNKQP